MRALIGCERSGVIRDAFGALGHEVRSCDLEPAEDASPLHVRGDVFAVFEDFRPDLFIVHPPCRYLTSSGLWKNTREPGRDEQTEQALDFVRRLFALRVEKFALENPQGRIGSAIRPADQYIQPYFFGEDASKRTGLWLRSLPPLFPTRRVFGRVVLHNGREVERFANQTDSGQNRLTPSADRPYLRAKTYPGIASAMALQWGT